MARPNILFIHCHDLGQHLGCYGIKTVRTPNLDHLAAQGVRFARSYCTSPSCSPSRASIFTGRWPHSNGVMGLTHADFAWDLHPEERHLGQLLKEGGYRVAGGGVIHETRSGAKRCGYETFEPNARAKACTDYGIAQIGKLGAGGQPWFLCLGLIEPHRLAQVHPETGIEGDNSFPGPGLEPDDSLGVQVPGYLRDTPGTRWELAGMQGMLRHVDEQVGRLLAALRDSGQEDNTLVVFTTDHGIAMPRSKCSLYEPGVSTALLMRLPAREGWRRGVERHELISNVDYVPTLLDLAELPTPGNVQGRSFAPLLDGRAYTPRDELCCEMTCHDYYDPRRSVRTERHKLIANFTTAPEFMDPSQTWRPVSDVATRNHAIAYHAPAELYDLQADPLEQTDLFGCPEAAEAQHDLLRRLQRHLTTTSDPILQGAITNPLHRRSLSLLAEAAR